jgi:hypothetical protein
LLERDKKLLAIQAAKPLGTVAAKMAGTVAAKLPSASVLLMLYISHHTEEVATPNEFDVLFAVALHEEATGEVDELGSGRATCDASIAIEVGADAYVLNAHHIHHVVEVLDGIEDRGWFGVGTEETMIHGDLCHTSRTGKCPHLFVGEIARMVAKGTSG